MRLLLFVALLFGMVAASAAQDFPQVDGPCDFDFPRDHGPHPDYRVEWWYYTGNVYAEDGRRFGFQLTFFRTRLEAPGVHASPNDSSSWRTEQLYLAHAAVSDPAGEAFYHDHHAARGAVGLAGARFKDGVVDVHLKDWQLTMREDRHDLYAKGDDFSYKLRLTPLKDLVLNGEGGYSRKGELPTSASCYYSFTRLGAEGELTLAGKRYVVNGTAWMDREYSSEMLEPGIVGWDWFSLQFDSNEELMLYFLRREDGTHVPASGGTYVAADGRAMSLSLEGVDLEAASYWTSAATGAAYPASWRLRLENPPAELKIRTIMADQEMLTDDTTGVSYYEGAADVEGRLRGRPVAGVGYAELTGYAGRLDDEL